MGSRPGNEAYFSACECKVTLFPPSRCCFSLFPVRADKKKKKVPVPKKWVGVSFQGGPLLRGLWRGFCRWTLQACAWEPGSRTSAPCFSWPTPRWLTRSSSYSSTTSWHLVRDSLHLNISNEFLLESVIPRWRFGSRSEEQGRRNEGENRYRGELVHEGPSRTGAGPAVFHCPTLQNRQ